MRNKKDAIEDALLIQAKTSTDLFINFLMLEDKIFCDISGIYCYLANSNTLLDFTIETPEYVAQLQNKLKKNEIEEIRTIQQTEYAHPLFVTVYGLLKDSTISDINNIDQFESALAITMDFKTKTIKGHPEGIMPKDQLEQHFNRALTDLLTTFYSTANLKYFLNLKYGKQDWSGMEPLIKSIDEIEEQLKVAYSPEYLKALNEAGILIDTFINLELNRNNPEDILNQNPVTEILEDAGLLSETDLLPRPKRHFKDNSLLGKAIFDPNNTLDENLNLQLIGFPGNKILVGEDRRSKEPIYNTVTIQFDRDALNEEWIKTKKSPLNDNQARVFDAIASIVCCQAGVSLDDPLIDTLKLIKTAPWKFNVTTALKMLYQTDKPKPKQIEEFKKSFNLFISHSYTIDTTHQNRVYIENALDKYYKENKLDRSSYNATLSEMFSAFDRVRDTKPFIRGWLREIDNPNGTITRICYIDEIPFLPNLLLTKQFSTYDSAIYQIPENTRIKDPNFYTLQGELARRIAEAGKLINSGNIKLLESGKKQYLFALDIENFLSDHAIEFNGTNPRRQRLLLLNNVIKAIRANHDNFPHFENLFLYPAKEGVKKTHIVMGYIGKNGHRICKDKYLQAKKDDAETTRRRAKRKAKKEEEKAKKAADKEEKL